MPKRNSTYRHSTSNKTQQSRSRSCNKSTKQRKPNFVVSNSNTAKFSSNAESVVDSLSTGNADSFQDSDRLGTKYSVRSGYGISTDNNCGSGTNVVIGGTSQLASGSVSVSTNSVKSSFNLSQSDFSKAKTNCKSSTNYSYNKNITNKPYVRPANYYWHTHKQSNISVLKEHTFEKKSSEAESQILKVADNKNTTGDPTEKETSFAGILQERKINTHSNKSCDSGYHNLSKTGSTSYNIHTYYPDCNIVQIAEIPEKQKEVGLRSLSTKTAPGFESKQQEPLIQQSQRTFTSIAFQGAQKIDNNNRAQKGRRTNCKRRRGRKAKEFDSGNLLVQQAAELSIVNKSCDSDSATTKEEQRKQIQHQQEISELGASISSFTKGRDSFITGNSVEQFQSYQRNLDHKSANSSSCFSSNYPRDNYTNNNSKKSLESNNTDKMQLHQIGVPNSTFNASGQNSMPGLISGSGPAFPFNTSELTNHLYVAHLLAGMSTGQLGVKNFAQSHNNNQTALMHHDYGLGTGATANNSSAFSNSTSNSTVFQHQSLLSNNIALFNPIHFSGITATTSQAHVESGGTNLNSNFIQYIPVNAEAVNNANRICSQQQPTKHVNSLNSQQLLNNTRFTSEIDSEALYCTNSQSGSSDSGGTSSDKENNLIQVVKMDSSYFSLSADDYSNGSNSSGSCVAIGGATMKTSHTVREGLDSHFEEDLPGNDQDEDCEPGCDCDKDSLLACNEAYSDSTGVNNSYYDVSDDAISTHSSDNYSTEIDQENEEPQRMHFGNEDNIGSNPRVVPMFSIPALVAAAELVQEQSETLSGSYMDVSELNDARIVETSSALVDVTEMYLPLDKTESKSVQSSGSAAVANYMLNEDKHAGVTKSAREAHQLEESSNAREISGINDVMTPNTFAATRQVIADTPITPTETPKLNQLNVNCIEALRCPIPELTWGDSRACWEEMLTNDDIQHRTNRTALTNHPKITAQHRAVVLEWLSEVTQSYSMRKDTFYLAVNFFDRFLSLTKGIAADKLQLLGTTALFTASKIEEIYPPPSKEFANVTDGACEVMEIIETEICLVQHLKWKLTPMTALQWLLLFLQIKVYNNNPSSTLKLIRSLSAGEKIPSNNLLVNHNFDPSLFQKAAVLLDLCTVSYQSLEFSPRVLAATVLLAVDTSFKSQFTCLDQEQLKQCFNWMRPFVLVARETYLEENNPEVLSERSVIKSIMLHQHSATMSALKEAEALAMTISQQKANAKLFHAENKKPLTEKSMKTPTEKEPEGKTEDDDDDDLFSFNPIDQINMVLLTPPQDEE
ncbi:uncharacterized protein LOC142339531 [Convolutriloba macropyga]|uniref:uncharacterized protein LOC142339531 n=1 Tax=Convolutriloba macropyga TaxID=536237 RepID=UPI003F52659B